MSATVLPVDPDTFLEFGSRVAALPRDKKNLQAAMILLSREFDSLSFEDMHNLAYRFFQIGEVIRDPRLSAFVKPTEQDSERMISPALLIACAVAEMQELSFDIPNLLKTAGRIDAQSPGSSHER